MRKVVFILLLLSGIAKGQDSVVHFHYWMKTKFDSIHAYDSFPLHGNDFKCLQLKDSTWFLPKENLQNSDFQGVIHNVEHSYLMDSIKFEPINDTLYIQPKIPF